MDTSATNETLAVGAGKRSDGSYSRHRVLALGCLHRLELLGSGMRSTRFIVSWDMSHETECALL